MIINKYQKCIDACNRCTQTCYECLTMCLNEPDVRTRKGCISILMECACICKESSAFMSLDAKYAIDLCRLCAVICENCAEECSAFSDDHCQNCADECNFCATECKMMGK